MKHLRMLSLLVGILCLFAGPSLLSQEKLPLTVEDCVSLHRLVSDGNGIDNVGVEISPDGSRIAYMVKSPNLDTDHNDYQIYVQDVKGAQHDGGAKLIYTSTEPLSGLTWLSDSRRVSVLTRATKDNSAVLLIDADTDKVLTVVHVATGIGSYSIDAAGDTIAYSTRLPTLHPDQEPSVISHGFSVPYGYPNRRIDESAEFGSYGDQQIIRIMKLSAGGKWDQSTILAHSDPKSSGAINPPVFSSPIRLSLSPDGHYLVFGYELTDVPEAWAKNRSVKEQRAYGYGPLVAGLYDVSTGGAPTVLDFPYFVGPAVRWSADSRGFAIYAAPPVGSVWEREDTKSESSPLNEHLFAVDVNSRDISEVLDGKSLNRSARILFWKSVHDQMLVPLQGNTFVWMQRNGHEWEKNTQFVASSAASLIGASTSDGETLIGIERAATIPEDIFVLSARTQQVTTLTDLNPRMRQVELGTVDRIDWKNQYGADSVGYLIKPVNYLPGKRYPLVLMAKGWNNGDQVCDTDMRTAFPPQPLANAGFLVLEVNGPDASKRPKRASAELAEVDNWVATVESAVDLLVKRNMTDQSDVGLIGFSRTAWYVDYILTQTTFPFKAASSADGDVYNYGAYWMNQDVPGGELEQFFGGPPYGATLKNWTQYASGFNADKVRTPLLMESTGEDGLWPEPYYEYEFFTALHRNGKPVDLFFYPLGEHMLDTPFERVASLQRNVDWFRFWMQGYEGTAPPYDPDQYVRWRRLRQQKEWNERMTSQGKDPAAEFLRQTTPGALAPGPDRAPAANKSLE